ncbi:MAG: hypothetical protein JRI55_07295 [Deltaproteobacteria bacterium]|nr:hypothetical protein [Deltaproteobacteria bacterium]
MPACAPPWTTEFTGGNGLTVPSAVCDDCSCGAPSIDCSMGTLRIYNNGDCSDHVGTEAPVSPHTCFYGNENDPDGYVATIGSPLSGSSCAESGGGVQSLPAASWDEEARLCLGTVHAGGCTNDNLCVPRVGLSSFARCIYRAGSFSCPPASQLTSPYTVEHRFNSAMSEGRSCSPCACDTPSNIQCHGQYLLWDAAGSNCAGTPDATVPTTSPCVTYHDLSGNFAIEFVPAYTSDPCQVSAGSGQPTGTVTETTPFTVCCLP